MKKAFRTALYVIAMMAVCLAILEFAYRTHTFGYYMPELTAFNRQRDLVPDSSETPTILIMGDSFSAGTTGNYPTQLRSVLKGYRVINSAIPGSGSIEARLIAAERFATFQPSIFIYQIFVGNDLFDIRYPVNCKTTSTLRCIYWASANHLWFIRWLNYRLAQIVQSSRARHPVDIDTAPERFSAERYTGRERLHIIAEPNLLDDTINLKGSRGADFDTLTTNIRAILRLCEAGKCQAYILVVPHKAQVSPKYAREYAELGLAYAESAALQSVNYPFLQELVVSMSDVSNLKIINPLERARRLEASGTSLFETNDGHTNSHGQRLLLRSILETLRGA